jgi:hypothetical protein
VSAEYGKVGGSICSGSCFINGNQRQQEFPESVEQESLSSLLAGRAETVAVARRMKMFCRISID